MKTCYSALTLDACATAVSVNAGRFALLSHHNRKVLKRKQRTLTHSINPAGHLIAACQSLGVFTSTDAEILKAEAGKWKRQVKLMIKILKRRPSSAIHGFVEALKETDHSHVADALLGRGKTLAIKGYLSTYLRTHLINSIFT